MSAAATDLKFLADSIDCPFCGKRAKLSSEKTEITYMGERFTVNSFFYACVGCGEEFTTTASDIETIAQVHEQYDKKHKQ